jgi:CHASE3 domain sensor protein
MSSLKANYRAKVTFATLGAIAALTVVFSFLTYRELQSVADTRRDTFESIIGASNLLSELKDAETGQRGFALTGDEVFLEPYLAVRDTVLGHLNGAAFADFQRYRAKSPRRNRTADNIEIGGVGREH